jgi:hypothetical protein
MDSSWIDGQGPVLHHSVKAAIHFKEEEKGPFSKHLLGIELSITYICD